MLTCNNYREFLKVVKWKFSVMIQVVTGCGNVCMLGMGGIISLLTRYGIS